MIAYTNAIAWTSQESINYKRLLELLLDTLQLPEHNTVISVMVEQMTVILKKKKNTVCQSWCAQALQQQYN